MSAFPDIESMDISTRSHKLLQILLSENPILKSILQESQTAEEALERLKDRMFRSLRASRDAKGGRS